MSEALLPAPTVNKTYTIPALMEYTGEPFNISLHKPTMPLDLFISHRDLASNSNLSRHHFIPKLTHSHALKAATIKMLSNK
jgi:hypothetical protein